MILLKAIQVELPVFTVCRGGRLRFIGFFLGLIGLVICLCIEDKTKQIPPSPFEQYVNPKPQYDHENGAQCPQCGMTNPIGAQFCNCCGNKLR